MSRYALLLLALPAFALAAANGTSLDTRASNGMDMSMDDGMSLAAGTMMTTLHFSRGDTLWFTGWVPQSAGAQFGACVGLFLLALVERWISAVRGMMEAHWREAGERVRRARAGADDKGKTKKGMERVLRVHAPPFIPAHDVMRGAMHALQAALGFLFMLAVMTFQAAFLITISLGLGVGELLFGRYGSAAAAH
ncbi:Ctr copper transporter family-domain-containing protein [Mycena sp. CBHHK59/15]|nr:Ctr copper transporter family-domain-containing protein [Mycena sp. CBHHK59/15]